MLDVIFSLSVYAASVILSLGIILFHYLRNGMNIRKDIVQIIFISILGQWSLFLLLVVLFTRHLLVPAVIYISELFDGNN